MPAGQSDAWPIPIDHAVGDWVAFFLQGELIEFGPGREVFTRPKDKRTEEYILGRYG